MENSFDIIENPTISESTIKVKGQNKLNEISKQQLRIKILEQWVIKEAAIKWQRGKLIQGLIDWSWDKKNNIAINRRLNYK